VRLMQVFSEDDKDYIPLVNALSLYFQIRDDYINLVDFKYHKNKGLCEDITEGKFSYPIIHAIHSRPGDTRLVNILKQRTEDVDVKKYAVSYMEETKSLEYTKERLIALKVEVMQHISDLGGHQLLEALVQKLDKQLETNARSGQQSTVSDDGNALTAPFRGMSDSIAFCRYLLLLLFVIFILFLVSVICNPIHFGIHGDAPSYANQEMPHEAARHFMIIFFHLCDPRQKLCSRTR